jgi:hypothetical protein
MSTASASLSVQRQTPSTGFTITGLVISGQDREAATVLFKSGLNIVVGASDAGKSHILEQIDHVFGSSATPGRFPENEGYTSTFVGLKGRGGTAEATLRRSMDGGSILLYEAALSAIEGVASSRTLDPFHDVGSSDTVSAFLLELAGLNGRRLRKNALGETVSLTFRFLSHLCFVTEEDMFRKGSPALSANKVQNTQDRAAFSLLLTGRDDGALIAAIKPSIKKTRILAQIDLVAALIADRQAKLREFGQGPETRSPTCGGSMSRSPLQPGRSPASPRR